MSRLRNELRRERLARGWSQEQVARLARVSRQSYAAIETGSSVPSTEVALRLAVAFDRRVEELFRLPAADSQLVSVRWAGDTPAFPGQRVRIAEVGGEPIANPLEPGERPVKPADGVVASGAGSTAEIALLEQRPPAPDLVITGCDPAVGVISEFMRRDFGVEVAWVPRGSLAALQALARGVAHVAGAHLRDPDGEGFNAEWVRRTVPFPCTRFSFAWWDQGLMVSSGNPLGIGSIEDLTRPEIRFLNREPGSGSRALLDDRLRTARVDAESIPGYGTSAARGHLAVAEAISSGLADAGVGIRGAALAFGLDLVPLETERYDLIVPDHFLDSPQVEALLRVLRRSAVQAQVEALGGYDVAVMGVQC